MQNEKNKKRTSRIIVFFLILVALFFSGLAFFVSNVGYFRDYYLSVPRNDDKTKMGGRNFLFDGRGCNEMINVSNEKIEEIIIENYIKDKDFKNDIIKARSADLKSLEHYNSIDNSSLGYDLKLKIEECINLENRILNALDKLNIR